MLAAHLDTVFAADVDHLPRREGDRLAGPGVGDDAVALAALGAVGRLLEQGPQHPPVYLLATVGEAGLGNLAGARAAVHSPPRRLAAFVAIVGSYLGRLGTLAVGSQRWRVEVHGRGGHAWEQSAAPSAVHHAAHVVAALADLPTVPHETALNVGRIEGGEAGDARARAASFDVEIRAISEAALSARSSDRRASSSGAPPPGASRCS